MGSPDGEAGRSVGETQHAVDIPRPFFMGMHEVTVGQFRMFALDQEYQTLAEVDGKSGSGYDAARKTIVSAQF
jgi:sulfatase modifying factor 1